MTVRTQRPDQKLVHRLTNEAVMAQAQRVVEIMEAHNCGLMETASDVAQRLWVNGHRVAAIELAVLCDLQEQADGQSVQRILGDYVQPTDSFYWLAGLAMDELEQRNLI